jgi:3-hydroxymyristoyl/3-hydroxydecanoyl-(acyl carrier protein) dehydratase
VIPTADAAESLVDWAAAEGGGASGRFVFKASLPVFRGHFPGRPLLPGVHQLAAVAETARRALGPAEVEAIERAKWSAPAFPDQPLAVEAQWREREGRIVVDGTVRGPDGVCATCRLILRP